MTPIRLGFFCVALCGWVWQGCGTLLDDDVEGLSCDAEGRCLEGYFCAVDRCQKCPEDGSVPAEDLLEACGR